MQRREIAGIVGRLERAAAAILLACVLEGCASTGTSTRIPVPQPFPMPDTPATAAADAPARGVEPEAGPDVADRVARPAFDSYALVGTALELRGTPYLDGGASPRGFDCSGFTQYVFAQHGASLPRAVRDQFRIGAAVRSRELAPGDLLFFSTVEPGASHVGIAVGADQFVHAPSSTGVVRIERLSSTYWAQRFVGARRIQ